MQVQKRGNVWLAVAGLVINNQNEWLVVKKKYGGLKGMWSLPAGFVDAGETVDEAVIREVKEETGLSCRVQELLGVRTGVIKHEISDNMILFLLEQIDSDEPIRIETKELYDVSFIHPRQLLDNSEASIMLKYIAEALLTNERQAFNQINPGDQFGYTSYRLFF